MKSKNATRTRAQKDWHNDLANMGCMVTGRADAEIDHLFGAMAKSNGLSVGQWAVIPLNDGPHRNDPNNRTSKEWLFVEDYCNTKLWDFREGDKKELFLATCCRYMTYYKRKDLPFGNDVLLAIMSYV